MENIRPISYTISQKQLVGMSFFTVILTGLGVWLTFLFQPHNHMAHYILIGVGIFCLLLAVFCLVSLIKRFTGPKEGLVITNEGIIDRTINHGIEVIRWKDIKGIREEMIAINKMIRIDVYNPQEYIAEGKNAFKRRLLKNNNRNCGSPFLVMARAVNMKHAELFEIMRHEFQLEKDKRTITDQPETPTAPRTEIPNDL